MTPEEIDAMPAGRKMDTLIALHVMGWTVFKADWVPAGFQYYQSPGAIIADTWEPSTDIAAAWQVVEKVNLMAPFGLQLVAWGGKWCAAFDAPSDDMGFSWYEVIDFDGNELAARANTAPLAICRAALKATLPA